MKGRLQEDDFVVDDGVGGYVDNGMDEYGQEDEFDSDVEEKRVDKKRKRTLPPEKLPGRNQILMLRY